MPRKSDLITISNKKLDRRVKLTDDQRAEIINLKGDLSQRDTAKSWRFMLI